MKKCLNFDGLVCLSKSGPLLTFTFPVECGQAVLQRRIYTLLPSEPLDLIRHLYHWLEGLCCFCFGCNWWQIISYHNSGWIEGLQMRICARLCHDVAMLCLARSFLQWKDDINFIAQDLIEQLRPNRPPSLQIFNPKCPVTPNFKRSAEEILFAERRGVE